MTHTYTPEFWLPKNTTGVAATIVYDLGKEYENLMPIHFYWPGEGTSLKGRADAQQLMVDISSFLMKYPFSIEDEKKLSIHFIYKDNTFQECPDPKWEKGERYKWPL